MNLQETPLITKDQAERWLNEPVTQTFLISLNKHLQVAETHLGKYQFLSSTNEQTLNNLHNAIGQVDVIERLISEFETGCIDMFTEYDLIEEESKDEV